MSIEDRMSFYKRWSRLSKAYFKWQYQQFSSYLGPRVADVGCGLGNFVPFLKNKEFYLGLEPDRELSIEFKRSCVFENVKLALHSDITTEESVAEIIENKIDSIICVNVLEHIYDDQTALANLTKGVSSGGHICILVPAFTWLFGTLDKLDGHYRRYSKKDLISLTNGLPVIIKDAYYVNFIGVFGWFIRGRVLKAKTYHNNDWKAMNLLVPLVSRLEKLIRPPIGLSCVLILQKIKTPDNVSKEVNGVI